MDFEALIPGLEEAIRKDRTKWKANIYLVGEDVVGKRVGFEELARCEYRWGKFAEKHGVLVPEMYGVVGPSEINEEVSGTWFVLMERIQGKNLFDMVGEARAKAAEQYRTELGKLLDLGVLPVDSNFPGNIIFNEEEARAHLIDFGRWKEGQEYPDDMKQFRKILEKGVPGTDPEDSVLTLKRLRLFY